MTVNGERDILGLWAGDGSEGAKFWLAVLTEIKNRGAEDVCILVCDGLKGVSRLGHHGLAADHGAGVPAARDPQHLPVCLPPGGRWVRREVLPAKGGTVLALAVNRAGTRAYSAGDDGIVTSWDLTDREGFGAQIRTPQVRGVDPTALIVIGDPMLAGRTGDWVVPVQQWERVERQGPIFAVFVDPRTREAVGSVRASVRPPVGFPRETVSLSPNGRLVAVTTMFSTAVIDVDHHRVVHQITLPSVPAAVATDGETVHNVAEPVAASAWSSDGRRLFLATQGARGAGRRGAVVVVDTATWLPVDRVLPPGDADSVAVSPDGRIIVLGTQSGDVVLAEAGTYQLKHRLHVDDRYSKVSFSADDTRLAVGAGRRLNVWDPRTGEPVFATVASVVAAVPACDGCPTATPLSTAATTDRSPSSTPTHRFSAASASRSSPTPAQGTYTSPRCPTAGSPSSGATAPSARPGKASCTRSPRPTGWPTPARSSGVTSPGTSGRPTCPAGPTAGHAAAEPDQPSQLSPAGRRCPELPDASAPVIGHFLAITSALTPSREPKPRTGPERTKSSEHLRTSALT